MTWSEQLARRGSKQLYCAHTGDVPCGSWEIRVSAQLKGGSNRKGLGILALSPQRKLFLLPFASKALFPSAQRRRFSSHASLWELKRKQNKCNPFNSNPFYPLSRPQETYINSAFNISCILLFKGEHNEPECVLCS